MEPAFWHKRWADNQIGFHQGQVNSYLQTHWPALGLETGSRVLVPLCGKSLDLVWLAGQGYRVLGVELSRRAVEDFFREHGLEARCSSAGTSKFGAVLTWSCGVVISLRCVRRISATAWGCMTGRR